MAQPSNLELAATVQQLQQQVQQLQQTVYAQQQLPAGTIIASAATQPPAGWLYCDGRRVPRFLPGTQIATPLFQALGNHFGVGDNSTTFNIPDLRGKFLAGTGIGLPLAATGGAASVTLATGHLPPHEHKVAINIDSSIVRGNVQFPYTGNTHHFGPSGHGIGNTSSVGHGLPFSIMPPYVALNYFIKE